jgi:prolyl-tRNA synthetase
VNLFERAKTFREANTFPVDSWDGFKEQIERGGFILAHWDGTAETEEKIKDETKATLRCIPLGAPEEEGKCVYTGKPSNKRVIFARAY